MQLAKMVVRIMYSNGLRRSVREYYCATHKSNTKTKLGVPHHTWQLLTKDLFSYEEGLDAGWCAIDRAHIWVLLEIVKTYLSDTFGVIIFF